MEQEAKRTNTLSLDRITFNPNVMGGKPCIRGMRVTVGMIVGLVASSHSTGDIIGVTTRNNYEIKQMDSDYFEDW